jgi:AraC family transcriptional regulator, transcriptional activator of pobA
MMIKATLLSLLTLLYRHFHADIASDGRHEALSRLRPILRGLDRDFASAPSLAEMAGMLHITPQHFCVLFKEATGQTFTDYLLTKRIASVKKALFDTDHGITEIAYAAGFHSLSYFNKAFRASTGMTPSRFRRLRDT